MTSWSRLLSLPVWLLLGGCVASASAVPASAPDDDVALEVHVFDIGQADSMLFIGPGPERRTMLVDLGEVQGGDGRNHLAVAARVEEITGARELDYLVVSHYHGDHTGFARNFRGTASGLFGLLEADPPFTVHTLVDRGEEASSWRPDPTRSHRDLADAVDGWIERGVVGQRVTARPGERPILLGDGVEVDVLAANGLVHEHDLGALGWQDGRVPGQYDRGHASENDFSIALQVRYGDFEMFTGGDLNGAAHPGDGVPYPAVSSRFLGETFTNVEGWMVAWWWHSGREADVEVYRANHHGSRFSSGASLLEALDPELILYSTGGQYGHPTRDVVERGAATADQLITSGVSRFTWPRGLPEELGRVAGEIVIEVDASGRSYRVGDREYDCWSDEEEAAGLDDGR